MMSILLQSVLGPVKYMAVVSAFQVYGGLNVRGATREQAIEVIRKNLEVDLRGIEPPQESRFDEGGRVYTFNDWLEWCFTLPLHAIEGSIFDQ